MSRRWFQRTESPSTTSGTSTRKTFPSGVKLLYEGESSVVDIIFVHGLIGDRERTWTAKNAPASWPQTLLPAKIPNARVLTFGYDAYVADLKGMVSKNRIGNHSMKLLATLATYRDDDDTNKRPIIFVCHSLGGLVVKDALIASQQRPEKHLQNILECTRGIIFLGTPHHGSSLAKWAEMLAKSIGLLKQTNPDILAVLKRDSEILARIQDGFHTMARSRLPLIEITCFFEELPLPGSGVVVPMDSAILPGYISLGIRSNHMDMTKFDDIDDPGFTAVAGELCRWVKEIGVTQAKQSEEASRQINKDLTKWINAPSYDSIYSVSLSKALPGTCQWIIHHDLVEKWMDPANSSVHCIWLYARIAGVGKTVAAATLVKHLKSIPDGAVAYFFCTHELTANQGPDGILRSWIQQLADTCGLHEIEHAYEISTEQDKPVDLWRLLRKVLVKHSISYLVIDGLDEMEEHHANYHSGLRAEFLKCLRKMVSETPTRLLIISRFDPDIERDLQTDLGPVAAVVQAEIDMQQVTLDVESVARHEVDGKFTTSTTEAREQIAKELATVADGMFVLLYALLEPISGCMSHDQVLYSISQRHSGNHASSLLDQAYERQLNKVLHSPRAVKAFCLSVLLWVQFSARPLNLAELLDALKIKIGIPDHEQQIPDILNHDDLDMHLLRHCGVFLRFQKEESNFAQGTLHLTHYSAKEFLQSTPLLAADVLPQWSHLQEDRLANAHLAKACLTYLMRPQFSKYPTKLTPGSWVRMIYKYDEKFRTRLLNKNPFYDYAAMLWGRHLDLSSFKPHIVTYLDAGFTESRVSRVQASLRKATMELQQLLDVISCDDESSYRHFLSEDHELQDLCLAFLDLTGQSCNYKVWLHYNLGLFEVHQGEEYSSKAQTIFTGEREILDPLYRAWVPPMWKDNLFNIYRPDLSRIRIQRRLVHALCLRSTGLVALLVKNGAEMGYVWPDSQTSFHAYFRMKNGNSSGMFDLLLRAHFGADFNIRAPIHRVEIPLDRGIFRAGGGGRFTPMKLWSFLYGNKLQHLAADWDADESNIETMRIMLNFWIDINNRSLLFPSAIHGAVMEHQTETVKMLVNNGGDANASCWLRPMSTFVNNVSSVGDTLLEMFLELVPSGGRSLGRAFGGLLRLVEREETYGTYRDKTIKILLSDTALGNNSAGWISDEQLQIATRCGDMKEVRRLLDDGVNVNRRGSWYGTALYVACYFGNKNMVKLLLDVGADPNLAVHSLILRLELEVEFLWAGFWRKSLAKEGMKNTPLQAASYRGHLKIVEMLLDHGADVNHNPAETGTALYFATRAAKYEHQQELWRSQRRGKGDRFYNFWRTESEIHRTKTFDIVKLLLDRDALVNIYGGRYWSPLQAACLAGREDIISLLLEKGAPTNAIGGEYGTALQAVLVTHSDPDLEAIKQGQEFPTEGLKWFPCSLLQTLVFSTMLNWCYPKDLIPVLHLAPDQAPDNLAYRIVWKLLEHGANPTIMAGPWGNAIQAAAFFSSIEVLEILLNPQFTNISERQRAVNTICGKAGSPINAALMNGSWGKATLMFKCIPGVQLGWRSFIILRVRRTIYSASQRAYLFLRLLWWLRHLIVFGVTLRLAMVVIWQFYITWVMLDAKADDWDPRIQAVYRIVSLGLAGYVNVLKDNWMTDTAW